LTLGTNHLGGRWPFFLAGHQITEVYGHIPWARFQDRAQEHLDNPDYLIWEDLVALAEEELDNQRQHEREVLERHGLTREPKEVASRIDPRGSKPERFESTFPTKLPEREKRRTDVLLKVSMRQAAERPDVKRFRNERLRGQLLFYDEAEAYISPGMDEEITDRERADLGR
jgi:hypothetical protein